MNYTCPKCGKKMDQSTQVLISSDYKVICPQCLSQLHIVGDYAYIPHDALELDTTAEPSRTINCPKCGHEASTGAHFCPNCGTSFDTQVSPPATVAGDDTAVMPPPLPASDPLLDEALQFLKTCTAITPMMLRDRFHISDERAAQLIRQLEAAGAVGPYNNGGPRQILIPHRGLYDHPMPQMAPGGQQAQPQPAPRRIGCFTWLLIIMMVMLLAKACGA